MNQELIDTFHEAALAVYEQGKQATGYRGTRYLQKVRKDGGLKAAKSWLRPRAGNDAPTGGFLKLVDCKRLDLSLEAQVIKQPWSQLFTDEELNVARSRLARYGYFLEESSRQRDGTTLAEEVTDQASYVEGACVQVTVNSYERNSAARKACIAHFGAECYVCGLQFGKKYGQVAEGYIHVHHLCPISTIGDSYQLDPIADLRPVCPNCHAVIHFQQPPLSIQEVKDMITRNS